MFTGIMIVAQRNLDGSIPDKDIKRMIAESYDLVIDGKIDLNKYQWKENR